MFQTCIQHDLRPSGSRVCVSHNKVNSSCTYHTNMSISTSHHGPSRHSLAAMSNIKTLAIPRRLSKSSPLSFLLPVWKFPLHLALGLTYHNSNLCSVPKPSSKDTYHIIALVCHDVGTTVSSLGCESPAGPATTRRLLPRDFPLPHCSWSVCYHPSNACGVHAPLFEDFQCPWAQSR